MKGGVKKGAADMRKMKEGARGKATGDRRQMAGDKGQEQEQDTGTGRDSAIPSKSFDSRTCDMSGFLSLEKSMPINEVFFCVLSWAYISGASDATIASTAIDLIVAE